MAEESPQELILADEEWTPNERQERLIRHMSTFPYPRMRQACETLDLNYGTCRNWVGIPGFKAALHAAQETAKADEQKELEQRLHGLSDAAVGALANGFQSKDINVRLRAASMVIDRVLGKPKDRIEHTGAGGKPIEVDIVARLEALWDKPLPPEPSEPRRLPSPGTPSE